MGIDRLAPTSEDLAWAGMSSQPSKVWSYQDSRSRTRLLNIFSISLRTSGSQFSLTYNTCLAGIRAVAKRCGITKHITWHQSRHTAATTVFLSNGVPIETVSSMLGHKSIKTTQIYAKITKEKLNQDMENLAARLNNVEEFAGCTI